MVVAAGASVVLTGASVVVAAGASAVLTGASMVVAGAGVVGSSVEASSTSWWGRCRASMSSYCRQCTGITVRQLVKSMLTSMCVMMQAGRHTTVQVQVTVTKPVSCTGAERRPTCWHSHPEASLCPLIPTAPHKRNCIMHMHAALPPKTHHAVGGQQHGRGGQVQTWPGALGRDASGRGV